MDVPPDLWMEVIDELPSEIALLNDEGMILFTNRQWRQFGCENGLVEREAVSIGENYLAVSDADDEHAQRVLEGLESLLAGEESQFSLEYPCHSPDEKRWFRMTATTLEHDRERYLVMEHLNITERRLAEITVREKKRPARGAPRRGPRTAGGRRP